MDRLLEAYKIGAIDAQLLKREMDKTQAEQQRLIDAKQDLEKQLQEAGDQQVNANYIEGFCNSISVVLDNLGFEEKRTILREVIERIPLSPSKLIP